MKKQRRTFTPEFKNEAASQVIDQGHSISHVCRVLDIGETALRRWVDQLKLERSGATPGKANAITPEQRRIQELEKRIRDLEEDHGKRTLISLASRPIPPYLRAH